MSVHQLIGAYGRLRRELSQALASQPWASCRAGHIQRPSGELGRLEEAMQGDGVPDELFAALLTGAPDLEHVADR
jgi:hypothetical protein